jgi:hypothetical protein
MPPIEKADLHEAALLWVKVATDNYGNHTVSASPTQIRVRWEHGSMEGFDPASDAVKFDASAVVDRLVEIGSLMRLGTLADWVGTGSGEDDNGLMQVVDYYETPDLKARHRRRVVGLMRYKDRIPGD